MDRIRLDSGLEVYTGLLEGDRRLAYSEFPVYEDNFPVKSMAEIIEYLQDVPQQNLELLFPAEQWIPHQQNNGCNGFATATALGEARVLRGCDPIPLDGDSIYSQISGNRDQGSTLARGMKAAVELGATPVGDEYIIRGSFKSGALTEKGRQIRGNFKAFETYVAKTPEGLLSGLIERWTGVIAVQVEGKYSQVDSLGRTPATDGFGNHAVAVDQPVLIEKKVWIDSPGSWGIRHAKRGRQKFNWDMHLRTTCRYHDFWLMRSTTDSKDEPNPPEVK